MVPIGTLCSQHGLTKVRRVVKGGESRTESVLAGLQETDPQAALVAIHDGARPFLPEAVLEEAIQAAAQHGAAAPAIPVKDTIKVAQAGVVQSTPDRGQLFAVQTPQVFDRALLQEALGQAAAEGLSLTDDCAAVERLGRPVYLTRGSEDNLKITTPPGPDLGPSHFGGKDGTMRIGHGYDVHRLVPGRKLILGGVEIPHHLGLLGTPMQTW